MKLILFGFVFALMIMFGCKKAEQPTPAITQTPQQIELTESALLGTWVGTSSGSLWVRDSAGAWSNTAESGSSVANHDTIDFTKVQQIMMGFNSADTICRAYTQGQFIPYQLWQDDPHYFCSGELQSLTLYDGILHMVLKFQYGDTDINPLGIRDSLTYDLKKI